MNKGKGIDIFVIIFSLSLLMVMSGETQEKREAGKGREKKVTAGKGFGFTASKAPIDITSDTVEANQKQNTITFKGNVVAKQEDTTLYADSLVIYYDPNARKLKEIMGIGHVKIVQLERRATSQKVHFHQDENKVVLDGEAVVREGENVIRGEKVIFYVDEQRTVVERGERGRVTTHITRPDKK